jgi:DNA (cytosine-5)-methyltransferase 1
MRLLHSKVSPKVNPHLHYSVGLESLLAMKKSKPKAIAADPARGLKILSFFTGAGGLDLGFEQAGFETVYATDLDHDSCDTLLLNAGRFVSKGVIVEQADICAIKPKTLPKKVDLIIGGPPCQSFSASGRRAGGASGRLDQRGQLFESYCRIIDHVRPKAFVFENVRGILGTNKGEDWKAIIASFRKIGYRLSYRLLDALDYGAPQQRERMFLVGHQLDQEFLFPEPTHGPDSSSRIPHVTAGEALKGINENEDLSSLRLVDGKYAHLLPLVPPGQNYLFFTAKRGYPNPIFAYRSRFSDFLYKASPKLPIKTLIASPGKYTGPLHWDNRYFSVKEYMRLQGFPDGYQFSGRREDAIRQIGNSVSPKIAYRLALAIAQQIYGCRVDIPLLAHDRVLTFDTRKGVKAQNTRKLHADVVRKSDIHPKAYFSLTSYKAVVTPSDFPVKILNTTASVKGQIVTLKISTDESRAPFAKMTLHVMQAPVPSGKRVQEEPVILRVEGYGKGPSTIQAMWNAVDDWVMRSSNFHSLFELYGHFTEPYPMFSIDSFEVLSNHPIATFAKHAAQFTNCSRYLPKDHLVQLFGHVLKTKDFADIANFLRAFRFDIRSKETNLAIQADKYMVAYPFTLPSRKQMNFKLHSRDAGVLQSSIGVQ